MPALPARGDVLVLLQEIGGLTSGFYAVDSFADDWAILRWVIDDERTESLTVTPHRFEVPVPLLELFMPVGINVQLPRLSPPAPHGRRTEFIH